MSQSEEQRWGWKLWKRLQWTLSYKVQSQVQAQIKMVNLVNIFLPKMIILTFSMAVDLFVFEIHQNWFYIILHL